jgi:hypothetical protein
MGESSGAEISVIGSELESFWVETPGGRIQIRWDTRSGENVNDWLLPSLVIDDRNFSCVWLALESAS